MAKELARKSSEANRKERAGKTLGQVKAVNEFLADVLDAVKDTGLKEAVAAGWAPSVSPWPRPFLPSASWSSSSRR